MLSRKSTLLKQSSDWMRPDVRSRRRRVECSRASASVHRKRRDIKNEISLLATLVSNQEAVAARRLSHITRDAAKAEKLRKAIAEKQSARPEHPLEDPTASQEDVSSPESSPSTPTVSTPEPLVVCFTSDPCADYSSSLIPCCPHSAAAA